MGSPPIPRHLPSTQAREHLRASATHSPRRTVSTPDADIWAALRSSARLTEMLKGLTTDYERMKSRCAELEREVEQMKTERSLTGSGETGSG